jgi:hypothetical protein
MNLERPADDQRTEVKMKSVAAPISRSALIPWSRSLLPVLALGAFAASADAQVDKQCLEATSLWIPSSTSVEKTVVKWNHPLKYELILPQGQTPEIVHTIEGTLDFMARQSGLKAELVYRGADVALFVASDISTVGPGIRKNVEDFIQQLFSSGIYQGKARLEIDPAKWEAKFRTSDAKCAGVDLTINGFIVRAFNWFQSDESAACVSLGLGEMFGLINIRKYYADHDRNVSADFIAMATRTLYDKRAIAGLRQAEAEKAAAGMCR